MITEVETDIMRDVYKFLQAHSDPPPVRSPACAPWWNRTDIDAEQLAERHGNHYLILQMLATVLCWLEKKMEGKT